MINRRYLVLGIALALAVVAFDRYFLMPRAETIEESVSVAYNSLRKEENFLRGAAAGDKDVSVLEGDVKALEKRLIPEKTEFLASVRLQDEVSSMADKAGLKLSTTRSMPASKSGNFQTVPLYFECSGNIKQLSDFLQAAESGTLMIRIDRLTVGITNIQNPKELKVKMQVSGVARI